MKHKIVWIAGIMAVLISVILISVDTRSIVMKEGTPGDTVVKDDGTKRVRLDAYIMSGTRKDQIYRTWYADGEQVDYDTVLIGADSEVVLEYGGDYDGWYVYRVNPEPYCVDDKEGTVTFRDFGSLQDIDAFEVEVREYRLLTLYQEISGNSSDSDAVTYLEMAGEVITDIRHQKQQELGKLKSGEKVVIRTKEGYKAVAAGLELTEKTYMPSTGETQYTYVVAEGDNIYADLTVCRNEAVEGAYHQPESEHGAVTLEWYMDGTRIPENEKPEDDAKVRLCIDAYDGYYVEGSSTGYTDCIKNMTYDYYVSHVDELMEEHPIRKLIEISLPEGDDTGKCTYRYNDKKVSGSVRIKEGETIEMIYRVTDDSFRVRDDGILDLLGKIFPKDYRKIQITADTSMDGRSLDIASYVQVEKK